MLHEMHGPKLGYTEIGQVLPDFCSVVRFLDIACDLPVPRICTKETPAELNATQESDTFYPMVLSSDLTLGPSTIEKNHLPTTK